MADKVIFLTTTGAGTFNIPSDWTNTNKIECIGGGGGGRNAAQQGGGGGGGAYSSISNTLAYTAGQTGVNFSVGVGGTFGIAGGDTFFGATTLASSLVGAKGGSASTSSGTAGGGAGGAASGGFPTSGGVRNSGGNGGGGDTGPCGGGGGGAGGPGGAGGNGGKGRVAGGGADYGGGGGSGAGLTTAGGPGTDGGQSSGPGGTNATGGGPGGNGSATTGSTPSEPATGMWASTHDKDGNTSVAQASTGGGGGGGGSTSPGNGGNGSFYGGGGGGCGTTTGGAGHAGRAGIIIITYTPASTGPSGSFNSTLTEPADTISGGATWTTTLAAKTFNANSGGWGDYTLRLKIPAGLVTVSGSQVRVTWRGPPSCQPSRFAKSYIGEYLASAADNYSMAASPTPGQFLYGGGADTGSIAVNAELTSDALTFSFDETKDYIISAYTPTPTASYDLGYFGAADQSGWYTHYRVATGDDAATTGDISGYSQTANSPDFRFAIAKLEVLVGSTSWTGSVATPAGGGPSGSFSTTLTEPSDTTAGAAGFGLIDTLPQIFTNWTTGTYNWTGKNLGDAAANNWVIAEFNIYGALPDTLTIGGVAASLVTSRANTPSTNIKAAIYKANVTAGGTGTVSATWTSGSAYMVTGALHKLRTANSVPSDTSGADGEWANASCSVTVPSSNGVAIFVGSNENLSTGAPLSGTGIVDDYSPATAYYCAVGSSITPGAATATVSSEGGSSRTTIIGAAWTAASDAWTGSVVTPPAAPNGSFNATLTEPSDAVQAGGWLGTVATPPLNTIRVKDAGVWKTPQPRVKDAGTWKTPLTAWVKDAGTWKKVFDAGLGAGGGDFTMPTYAGVPLRTTAHARVTVAGFGSSKTATLSGSGATFRKNAGAFGTANLTVSDGDVIDVIWPASASYNTLSSATLTIDGVARTGNATTATTAANNILAFYFNPLSLSAESALGGDWATHQTKWTANRRPFDPDYTYDDGAGGYPTEPSIFGAGSAWDLGCVYFLMSYLRGSGNSADTADMIAYMDDYNERMPNAYHSQDAWALGINHFIDTIYNSRNSANAGSRLAFAEWQHDGFGCASRNNFNQYWSQRWLNKDLLAAMGATWAGIPNGTYSFGVADFTGGPPALFRSFVDAAISIAETDNGFAGKGMYHWPLRYSGSGNNVPWSKPWQDGALLQALCQAYHHFYRYDDALKARIIGGAEWLWAMCIQYTGTGSPFTPSNSSGKWGQLYVNRATPTDGDETNWIGVDLAGFSTGIFGYCYYLTGDVTWRTRLRRLLKSQVTDAWYTAGHYPGAGYYTGNKIMGELVFTPFASYADSQTYTAPSWPICTADPVGSIVSTTFTITSDGTWSGSPTATEREIWIYNPASGSAGVYRWAAAGASLSTSGLSGQWMKGRVRQQNAAGWSCWADTGWSQVP